MEAKMTVAQLARWLPAIEDARRWSQSLAVLDAIVSEDRFYRHFSFDSQFGSGHAQASMDNGQGDEYSITFGEYGALALGLDHESQLGGVFAKNPSAQWPALFTGIPPVLAKVARQSVRTVEGMLEVTVALWRVAGDDQWRHGPVEYPPGWEHHYGDPDGSGWLFDPLDGQPSTYLEYARGYFERQLPAGAVTAIFEHRPVTDELVRALNPERVPGDLADDLKQIGYPAR
jgi:hypothetical protein